MSPDSPQQRPDPAALAARTSELDALESGRPLPSAQQKGAAPLPPHVKLGRTDRAGVAPPALVKDIDAEVQLEFEEAYPPVRVVFGQQIVLVEDGAAVAPDLRVQGALPDLVSLMVTPLLGGLPNPIDARGRAALGMVVLRRVRFEGRLTLMRRLIRVIRV